MIPVRAGALLAALLCPALAAAADSPKPSPPPLATLGAAPAREKAPAPPVAPRKAHPTQIHGETLPDDYYWLREKGTPAVESYLGAERAYSDAFMKPTAPLQETLYQEMLSRIQQTDVSVPYRDRGYYYYSRTEEGKQYPLYARKRGSPQGPEEVMLDVNALAAGKPFMSVGGLRVSPNGNLLAYTTDDTGFRQYTLRVRDLRTGEDGGEAIPRVTSFDWTEDGRSILYTTEDEKTKRSHQLWRHVIGGSKDDLLLEEEDERFSVYTWKTRDRRYFFVDTASLTSTEVRDLPADGASVEMKVIAPRRPEVEYDADHREGVFWIRANDKGRNFRLVTAPAADPRPAHWKEVVPHREDVMLNAVDLFEDFYVLVERAGGLPRLRVTTFEGGETVPIEFPEEAYVVYPSVNREYDAEAYRISYQSPITSSSIYDYDPRTREKTLLKQVAVLGGFDPSKYRVEVTQAPARDGVKVPMWLLYRKDLVKNGKNPALLYAYGSYGSSNNASFNSNLFSLVDRGVVYAMAYIRGGGELGKKWHDEGRMMKKMNTFTDFIDAAEHLVREKYTNKDRLAIMGGSAGGLLMGAVTNMRPDLFEVVISYVPFVDVINTMLDETLPLTVGEFEEWGNPKVPEQFRYMKAYSPYDNLARREYPTMLVKSSYNDSQVMYWEPAKYVARLRRMKTDDNPLLFHIDMSPAGHGGKSGRYDRLRELAFDYAFILWQLGVEEVGS